MQINNTALTIVFLCLVLTTGFSLWSIYHFMPIEATCQDEFAIINKCGCVPCDAGLVDLFSLEKDCQNNLPYNITA